MPPKTKANQAKKVKPKKAPIKRKSIRVSSKAVIKNAGGTNRPIIVSTAGGGGSASSSSSGGGGGQSAGTAALLATILANQTKQQQQAPTIVSAPPLPMPVAMTASQPKKLTQVRGDREIITPSRQLRRTRTGSVVVEEPVPMLVEAEEPHLRPQDPTPFERKEIKPEVMEHTLEEPPDVEVLPTPNKERVVIDLNVPAVEPLPVKEEKPLPAAELLPADNEEVHGTKRKADTDLEETPIAKVARIMEEETRGIKRPAIRKAYGQPQLKKLRMMEPEAPVPRTMTDQEIMMQQMQPLAPADLHGVASLARMKKPRPAAVELTPEDVRGAANLLRMQARNLQPLTTQEQGAVQSLNRLRTQHITPGALLSPEDSHGVGNLLSMMARNRQTLTGQDQGAIQSLNRLKEKRPGKTPPSLDDEDMQAVGFLSRLGRR